jgi:hypothetical protein
MTIAADWPTQLSPILTGDMTAFINSVAVMWAEVEPYQADPSNDVVSWQPLLDVDLANLQALMWLAQCVGDRVPVGFTEDQARAWVKATPNWNRGTPAAIVASVKRVLTGSQTVLYRWRSHLDLTFDVDCVAVQTYASETPDPQIVRNQLRRNVPADIIVEYQCVAGATWSVFTPGLTWAQFRTNYGPTWANVRNQQPGFNPWG